MELSISYNSEKDLISILKDGKDIDSHDIKKCSLKCNCTVYSQLEKSYIESLPHGSLFLNNGVIICNNCGAELRYENLAVIAGINHLN